MSLEKKVNLSRKQLANTSLSNTQLAVILGGLLGGASLKIYPGYKNARYSFRHSVKQNAYFYAKCKLLQPLSGDKSIQKQKPDAFSKNPKLRYQSKALVELTKVHAVTHRNNKLQCRRKWLNHFTCHSLAIWWFDDGSIIGNGRKGVISTKGFSEKECEILASYLQVMWKIKTSVASVEYKETWRTYHCLYISTLPLQEFLKLIIPYLPCKEMVYKCFLRYKSQHLQQRWISQMLELCPQHLRNACEESIKTLRE